MGQIFKVLDITLGILLMIVVPLVVALLLSVGYALYTSPRSFIHSFINHINPYKTYIDKSPNAPQGIKRNYFFGPGYHQIRITVQEAFTLQTDYFSTLVTWKNKYIGKPWYYDILIEISYWTAVLSSSVLGFLLLALFSVVLSIVFSVVFSIVLSSVLFIGMCIFYILLIPLRIADRLLLKLKSIQSRCPHCKRISVVPIFICPNCGLAHKNLTPGPYGVLKRKCACWKNLSTTYFNGRSKYAAVCPFCLSGLAASDALQFGIQLVGDVNTGKTTFLAAFLHDYLKVLKSKRGVSLNKSPEIAFSELEKCFQGGVSVSTIETNANMYSLIHKIDGDTPIQMAIYDIAGEAFISLENNIQQQQFKYCEGIVFVVDPTVNPTDTANTASSFIHEFSNLKGKHSVKTSDVPVAVIISKSDLYKKEIGLPKIRASFYSNPQKYSDAEGNVSLELTRNGMCRDFLKDNGFINTINLLEAEFNNVNYYSVSAMGNEAAAGKRYEPWGVLEPVIWLLQQQGSKFQKILSLL